jgi:hypothetical protein
MKRLAAKDGKGLTEAYCTETLNLLLPLIFFILSDGCFIGSVHYLLKITLNNAMASYVFLPFSIIDALPIIYLMSMH